MKHHSQSAGPDTSCIAGISPFLISVLRQTLRDKGKLCGVWSTTQVMGQLNRLGQDWISTEPWKWVCIQGIIKLDSEVFLNKERRNSKCCAKNYLWKLYCPNSGQGCWYLSLLGIQLRETSVFVVYYVYCKFVCFSSKNFCFLIVAFHCSTFYNETVLKQF